MGRARPPVDSLLRDGLTFLTSLHAAERQALGAHYTSERDIQKIIQPTIVQPWQRRLAAARSRSRLLELHAGLCRFRILDPACGCGHFLLVAWQELRRLDAELRRRLGTRAGSQCVSVRQLFGIEVDARAADRARRLLRQCEPGVNPDANIICDDALFCPWPKVDAIIGNPPFQSKNKMQQAYGVAYLRRLRSRYPEVPGRADYCVYWFRRAHDELAHGGRAGLVGTNTIGQNYSRQGGLDYIVASGGTIVEAVASQAWSGDAAVNVAIVNWVKGNGAGPGPMCRREPPSGRSTIPASLRAMPDVAGAQALAVNRASAGCYQGQTHGHAGFLVSEKEAGRLLQRMPDCREVLFPYLTGDELLDRLPDSPWRWVIDFHPRDLAAARAYPPAIARIAATVLPARRRAAASEAARNRGVGVSSGSRLNWHHRRFLERWWQLSYPRPELIARLRALPRYIACSRVTTYPVFTFVSSGIHPSDVVQVFPFADDYSFGVLQSSLHWEWFRAKCSTLGNGPRYTSETVFNTFPWPQQPAMRHVKDVVEAAVALRACRARLMEENGWSFRQLYRAGSRHPRNPLAKAQRALDRAVSAAYQMPSRLLPDEGQGTWGLLAFLLAINHEVAKREGEKLPVSGPGLSLAPVEKTGVAPGKCADFVSADCMTAPAHIITTDAGNSSTKHQQAVCQDRCGGARSYSNCRGR